MWWQLKWMSPEFNTITMKKCVAYYRVSTDSQEDLRQYEDIRKYCNDNSFEITKEFEEKISGTVKNRSEMSNMLSYIDSNNIQYVIISEIERLGRTSEVAVILDELTRKKVCVISLKENLRTLNEDMTPHSDNTFLIDIYTAIAKKELLTLKYRIKSGKNICVLNGGWIGGKYVPYGYQISKEKKLVVNATEAEIIKLIYDKWTNENWGLNKIANYLNFEKIPTRLNKLWIDATLRKILSNSIYAGRRNWQGKQLETEGLRIIPSLQYENALKRLKTRKNVNRDYSHNKRYDYLFDKRIIECGVCGKWYIGEYRRNNYKCVSCKRQKGCGNRIIKMNFLELSVNRYIGKHWMKLIKDNTKQDNKSKSYETDINLYENDRTKQLKLIEKYKRLFTLELLNETELLQNINECKSQIETINKNIIISQRQRQANKTIQQTIFKGELSLQSDNTYKYKKLSFDKDTLHSIIQSITIYDDTIKVLLVNGVEFNV